MDINEFNKKYNLNLHLDINSLKMYVSRISVGSNINIVIIGSSGCGKSLLVKDILLNMIRSEFKCDCNIIDNFGIYLYEDNGNLIEKLLSKDKKTVKIFILQSLHQYSKICFENYLLDLNK